MSMNPDNLAKQVEETVKKVGNPPIDQWDPELSGDMDLRISRDGQWIFKGEPLAYDLAEHVVERNEDGHPVLGVFSHGIFYKIGQGG